MGSSDIIANRILLISNEFLPLVYDQDRIDELFIAIGINPTTEEFNEENFVKVLREFDLGPEFPQLPGSVHSARASYELAQRARLGRNPSYLRAVALNRAEPIDPRILTYSGLENAVPEAAIRGAVEDRNQSIINFYTLLPEIVGNKIYFGAAIGSLDSGFGLPAGFPTPFPQFPSDPIPDLQDSELTGALGADALGPTNTAKDVLESTIIGMIGVRVNPILLQVVALTFQVDALKRIVKQLTDRIRALGG